MKVIKLKPVKQLAFETITVELSYDEALVLYDVLYRVSGSPSVSRRQHANSILEPLRKEINDGISIKSAVDIEDGIHFRSHSR